MTKLLKWQDLFLSSSFFQRGRKRDRKRKLSFADLLSECPWQLGEIKAEVGAKNLIQASHGIRPHTPVWDEGILTARPNLISKWQLHLLISKRWVLTAILSITMILAEDFCMRNNNLQFSFPILSFKVITWTYSQEVRPLVFWKRMHTTGTEFSSNFA